MHELSIAQNLLGLCEQVAKKQNATKVKKVFVKIGRLSGVEAHYLANAFDVTKAGSVCNDSELIINVQNVIVLCKKCGTKSELSINEFICPNCISNELEIIDGEDMHLMRVELE